MSLIGSRQSNPCAIRRAFDVMSLRLGPPQIRRKSSADLPRPPLARHGPANAFGGYWGANRNNNRERNMASITERKRSKAPSKWEVAIRVGEHKERRLFDTKAEAEEFIARTEPAIRKLVASEKSKLGKLRKKNPSYVDFYDRKLIDVITEFGAKVPDDATSSATKTSPPPSEKKVKKRLPSTHGRDIGAHRGVFNTVLKHVGNVRIGDARKAWVADYVERMRRTQSNHGSIYSYGAIGKHLVLMKAACEWAALKADLDEAKLYFNRSAFPKGWKNKTRRIRRLEEWEDKLMVEMLQQDQTPRGQHWLALYQLALETGTRLQELVLAEWREINHNGRVWVLPEDHTKTKTERMVSLTPEARVIVERLRTLADKYSPFIFHSLGTVHSVSNGFRYRVKKAGIKDLRFHDLRHEAISRLVVHPNQPSLLAVMNMVGHKSYEMITHYTHLREAEFSGLFG